MCVCVKVDENEQENKRGKIDINGYELAWPTIFFLLQLKQIEATTAAVRLLFRSLKKLY